MPFPKELIKAALEQCNIEESLRSPAYCDTHALTHATDNITPRPRTSTLTKRVCGMTRSTSAHTIARQHKTVAVTEQRVPIFGNDHN